MTIPSLLCSNNAVSPTTMTGGSTSYYIPLGNVCNNAVTTESQAQYTERASATYSHLYALIQANSRSTSSTMRFRKNGANGNQTASITASTTGTFMDASNTDSVVATDLTCAAMVTGTGSSSQTVASVGAQYDPASGCKSKYLSYNNGIVPTIGSASTTYHTCLAGVWSIIFQTSGDSDVRFPVRAAGTVSNFFINVSANTRTTSTTAGIRKTGAAGNNTVSVSSTATGTFEDTSNSDSVSSSDFLSIYFTTGSDASHSASIRWGGAFFTSSGSNSDLVCFVSNSKARGTTSNTYVHLTGDFGVITTTTEGIVQDVIPFACRLSNLRVRASGLNSVTTWALRVNGANGNQSVSTSSSGSGVFEDTTSHDDITANDKVAVQISSASSLTSNFGGVAATIAPQPGAVSGSGSGLLPNHFLKGNPMADDELDVKAQLAVMQLQMQLLTKTVDGLTAEVKTLTALANQGKGSIRTLLIIGGLWTGLVAFLSFAAGHLTWKP